MSKLTTKLQGLDRYFSLQGQAERQYSRYEKEYHSLAQLSEKELSAKYVTVKSKYEHKKNIFFFSVVTIILTSLMGIWEGFYRAAEGMASMADFEEMGLSFWVEFTVRFYSIMFVFAIVVLIASLVRYAKNISILHRELLLIEEVRKTAK